MTGLSLMIMVSVGLEKFIDLFKQFIYSLPFLPDKLKPVTIQLIAAGLGILVAFGAGLDLFKMSNIHFSIPYIGTIAAGLVLGRGSNAIHDFFSNINPSLTNYVNEVVPPQTKTVEQKPDELPKFKDNAEG